MAYDGYMLYDDVEIINLRRTALLSMELGVDSVRVTPESVSWIEPDTSDSVLGQVSNAPWYSAYDDASMEFAGIIPLSVVGLDDSSLTSTTTEYITDGGKTGTGRNATLPVVFSLALVALTARGVGYGRAWLEGVLRDGARGCAGEVLRYVTHEEADWDDPEVWKHRNDVRVTRGISTTRKRANPCSHIHIITFTMTAGDPFEYGDREEWVTNLRPFGAVNGPAGLPNPVVISNQVENNELCPVYDYSPIYNPAYPALVPSPTAPNEFPLGWSVFRPGLETLDDPSRHFHRRGIRTRAPSASVSGRVPVLRFTSDSDKTGVRFSIWPGGAEDDIKCGPLWSVSLPYLPGGDPLWIDGETQSVYVVEPGGVVRRADTLVFDTDTAGPIRWKTLREPRENALSYFFTLDYLFHRDSDPMPPSYPLTVDIFWVTKAD